MANREWQETVIRCVGMLAEAYGRVASKAMIGAYSIGLKGLTVEQIGIATERALSTCKFMPTPVELRELSGELKLEQRAALAWLAFAQALSEHGYYRTVQFDDPAITAAVRSLGGWEQMSVIAEEEGHRFDTVFRDRFLRTYMALAAAGVSPEQSAPLPGFFDRVNACEGYEPQPVQHIETGLPVLPQNPRIAARRHTPALELKPKE